MTTTTNEWEIDHDCGDDSLIMTVEEIDLGDQDVTVYVETRECEVEDCGYRERKIDTEGEHPHTVDDLLGVAWTLYRDVYDTPRRVSYFSLSALVTGDFNAPVPAVDLLARAVDLGCADAENERVPLCQGDLRDRLAEQTDWLVRNDETGDRSVA